MTVTSWRGYCTKIHTNSKHCILQTVLLTVQAITFIYTSIVTSSAVCRMSVIQSVSASLMFVSCAALWSGSNTIEWKQRVTPQQISECRPILSLYFGFSRTQTESVMCYVGSAKMRFEVKDRSYRTTAVSVQLILTLDSMLLDPILI